MEFQERDRILRREDRKPGYIVEVTEPPRPYRVQFDDDTENWFEPEQLMLDCKCDLLRDGCVCGASKREREKE